MSYPILLDLAGRRAVIVGGGAVAARKAIGLVEANARVAIISPALTESLMQLVRQGLIEWDNSVYVSGKLQALSPYIVVAATNSPTVNDLVVTEASSLGVLVDGSDFSSMAVVRRGSIVFAVGTSGASPALAVHLREKLEASFGDEYGLLAMWLAYLRPCVQNQIQDAHQRQNLWRELINSEALVHLQQGDVSAACSVINALLEQNGIEERL